MGIPRVWAIERDLMLPLGKREPHGGGLVVVLLVVVRGGVSVAGYDNT